jgi:hypothetical protein
LVKWQKHQKKIKTPKVRVGKKTVDNITGQWAEEGFFISGTGVNEDGPYEDEGPFGFLRSDRLPNGRYIFDQASYNPSNYSKERWILFNDLNKNQEFDSTDKTWGYAVLSKEAINIIQKGLDFPFESSTENAGSWMAQIGGSNSSGKIFKAGFHAFDIQVVDASVFS